ncbi:PKD domain-containing protein [Paracidobacterium acidisoli]|nr:PKD domain-containing protein [Paracidobacterium acidisoli]MBT9333113.1 alpha-galactosidase [Paracidobacterium acidisoli]
MALCIAAPPCRSQELSNGSLAVRVQDGTFQVATRAAAGVPVLIARSGAEIDHTWVRSSDYPQHHADVSTFEDSLGAGSQIRVTCSGLQGKPDLIYTVELYDQRPYAAVQVEVRNHTGKKLTVQALRNLESTGQTVVGLDGPDSADRVMSDSFSENWPLWSSPWELPFYDLGAGPLQMHRAAGSQLIYNRESGESLFVGALSADRFLTLMHLKYQGSEDSARITSYTVDSTGTTEIQSKKVKDAPELSLPLADGESMASERIMIAAGTDYHSQLLAYGEAIRLLHHARVTGQNMMGWWSWTSYEMAVNEGSVLTNAQWMAENLKQFGYDHFFIDEGYQYARGEYTTPNARFFPDGMRSVGATVSHLGLTFGVWTAPFEVSDRAWVYLNHKDWLVHTADGTPIPVVKEDGDTMYALDTTHPGAQEYMRRTYTTLTREWGVRYIKLDFMDRTAIEGYRYRPDVTALQAQLIGLKVIRRAVGDDVLIDKDGSPMLTPVGIVDEGRISHDTGHTFENTKSVALGIAARYFMNRNYFLDDPDAFNIAAQVPVTPDPGPNGRRRHNAGQTLDEAQDAIVLSAVSGGMYEIGDDLPILSMDKDRLDLLKNRDLLDMVKISRAATPVDLLSYDPADGQPSIFFLREDQRQSILVVYNWTDRPRSHVLRLADFALPGDHLFQAYDVLNQSAVVAVNEGTVRLDDMPRHSVRVIKLIDSTVPAAAPVITADVPRQAAVSKMVHFSAKAEEKGVPALGYRWDFGDGTTFAGPQAVHAYTHDGDFTVQLTADRLDGIEAHQSFIITVTGTLTSGSILQNTRYTEPAN